MFSGLSIRSLWGPEGRWALIVKEMIQSGNYFLPTANGVLDFDKPLLSYWAVVPFALNRGLAEGTLRIPSALAGVASILVVFAIGRRLMGLKAGFLGALLLLSTTMIGFWARTASAEVLNLFSIWLMFWVFLAGACDGRLRYILLLYAIGAVSCFLKGPVAAAVTATVMVFYGTWGILLDLRKADRPRGHSFYKVAAASFRSHFRFIASWQGLAGMGFGIMIFAVLLLLPVLMTGSWVSVELMWKENVTRFFSPFDHRDPPYTYLQHIPVFAAPWTLIVLASLWIGRFWERSAGRRWMFVSMVAILFFFTVSGSRRGYYILPLIPCLALIAGKTLSDWFDNSAPRGRSLMTVTALSTVVLVSCTGMGLIYARFFMQSYGHPSMLPAGLGILAASIISFFLMKRGDRQKGFALLAALVLGVELWAFTVGTGITERRRTLRAFADVAKKELIAADKSEIAVYQYGTASLIFYLGRKHPIMSLNSMKDVEKFRQDKPGGFIFIDLNEVKDPKDLDYIGLLQVVCTQPADRQENSEHFVLLRFPGNLP